MKIKRIVITLLIVSVMLTLLVACSKPQVTLTSIEATYSGDEIEVGGALNKTDITVTATYSDKTTKQVTDFTVGSLDTITAGDKKVTVTYTEGNITKTCELTISVVDNSEQPPVTATLQSITAEYIGQDIQLGGALDKADIKVTASYSDNTTKQVTGFTVSLVDTTTAGDKQVTVTYTEDGVTKTFVLTVTVADDSGEPSEVVLKSIEAEYTGENIKIGTQPAKSDVVVTATYSDNSKKRVDNFTLSNVDTSVAGNKTVTVTYSEGKKEVSCTFVVRVKSATSLEVVCDVDTVPHNGTLSEYALTVYVVYDDESRELLSNTQYLVDADFSKVGETAVTVTYNVEDKQLTDSVAITVVKVLSGIRAEYSGGVELNGAFDESKVTVYKLFSDDTEEKITDGYEVITDGFSSAEVGTTQVLVKLVGSEYQYSLTVQVYDPSEPATVTGIRAEYTGDEIDVGEQYDKSLVKVYKVLSDGTEEQVTVESEYELGTLNSATEGAKNVTVTAYGFSTTFEVVVNDVATLYFYNYAQWENVYAHYWKENDPELTVSTEWPGVAMTKEEDTNWYYIVVDAECQNIIFHNNVSGYIIQTDNLTIDYAKPYYAIMGWSDVKSVENILVLDLSVSPWVEANARFAVNMWKDGSADPAVWLDLKGVAGENKEDVLNYKYYAVDTTGVNADMFILCRMNPATSDNNWGNKWNQTTDLQVSNGLFVKLAQNDWGTGGIVSPEQQRTI